MNIVGIDDPWIDAFKKIIPEFEKLTGAKINLTTYSYDATYQREVLLGNTHSSSEDLYVFDVPWVGKFAMSNYIVPLNSLIQQAPKDLLDYNDFFSVMRSAVTWNGKIVGLPFAPYWILLTYNKAYFDKAGIKRPPQTIDEFVKDAKMLTNNPKLPGVYGVGMNNASGSAVGQAYFEYIYNFGGKPFKSEYPGSPKPYANMTPLFTSPQSKAVVKMFKDLLKYEPPGALNMDWSSRQSAFAAGHIAMANQWDDVIPALASPDTSAVVNQFSTAPEPHLKGVKLDTPLGGWTMGINKYSKNQKLAWAFMEWFTSPEVGAEFCSLGGFPARYSVLKDPALIRQYPFYKTLAKVTDTSFAAFRPQIPESFEIIDTLGTYIAQYLSGALTEDQALEKANKAVADLMRKDGYHVDD
ncbi:MAG: extracellular solute-binding protein [Alicyclobacillus sp.]|nr:extracellular solute-binding protein [Alicyclobacillus sp.]